MVTETHVKYSTGVDEHEKNNGCVFKDDLQLHKWVWSIQKNLIDSWLCAKHRETNISHGL